MKRALALLLLGALAPLAQGAAATLVPPRYVPDLSLLLVIALGVHWRSAPAGLLLALCLGFLADVFSGSLLGQHALLRVLAFAAARGASSHLNLRGVFPQATFVAGLTLANAAALGALTAFFVPGADGSWVVWRDLLPQACVNATAAPFVVAGTAGLIRLLGDEDTGRRVVLDPRRRAA